MKTSWKRNLAILWIAEVLSISGFSVVLPFLPYYVQELGVTDFNQVAFWSGLLTSSQAVTMALIAPVWGALADRYGRKLMVARAMFGGTVIMTLMGFVQNVQQLVVLRAIQGLLTGTVAAATTLVASGTPEERRGSALGMLQMAIYSGASLGPLMGGLIADQFGHRPTFWITGSLLFVSGLMVMVGVQEEFTPPAKKEAGQNSPSMWAGLLLVLQTRALLVVFGIRILVRGAARVIGPILPLFVQSITTSTKVASLTGTISGLEAAMSAVSAVVLGRMSDRFGARRILIACSMVSVVLYVMQAFVQTTTQLMVLRMFSGLAMGGIVASVSALQAALVPKQRFGAVYGIDTSLVAAANAIAPMVGAALTTTWGLSAAFVGTAVVYALTTVIIAVAVPRRQNRPA
ncbi:MAG: MFS transporter [Anaerolineae bacterium]|nr:MFS transporter [Anaerolineae bacterium]